MLRKNIQNLQDMRLFMYIKDQMQNLPTKIELTANLAFTFINIAVSGNDMLIIVEID